MIRIERRMREIKTKWMHQVMILTIRLKIHRVLENRLRRTPIRIRVLENSPNQLMGLKWELETYLLWPLL